MIKSSRKEVPAPLNEIRVGMGSDDAGGSGALRQWAALNKSTGGSVTCHRRRAVPPPPRQASLHAGVSLHFS